MSGEIHMSELQRHRLTFKLLTPVIELFVKLKFNYEYDDLREVEGPYLLLVNHNLELDPALVGVAAGKQLYFVASEHILRKGLGTWFLMTFFKPIIHMKGRQGMQTVRQMLKTLKDGHSVCLFPEGNRSFNGLTGEILPSIGKVALSSGAKLVTYRIEGGYLTQPRWSLTLRKGKLKGRLIHVYSHEDLKKMTGAQISEAICQDLHEDAYETQKKERIAFKGKNLALGLESTIFMCPDCGKIGTLHSKGDHFYCDCGFDAVYDVYGELSDKQGKHYTVTELDRMQQKKLQELVETTNGIEEPLFTDKVFLYEIDEEHNFIDKREGLITAYGDRLICCEETFTYEEIQGMAIYSRNAMILHVNGHKGHYEIKSDESFCALKYLYLYQLKEKMK